MRNVKQIAAEIIAREGGYVDDPDDPGGPTKYGVTIHTMRRLGIDLTGDGRVDSKDVKRLSKAQATDIFITDYFTRPKIGALPRALQATVFDMHVNAGSNAIKILQRVLIDMGEDIAVDGAIGPQTIKAAHRAWRAAPKHLVDIYGIARRNYYYELADRRPASRKYARRRDGGKGGWIARAEEFISPQFHLSDAQHQQRTKAWV